MSNYLRFAIGVPACIQGMVADGFDVLTAPSPSTRPSHGLQAVTVTAGHRDARPER